MYDFISIGNPVYDIIITPNTRTDGRVLSGCSTNACLAARKLGLRKVALIGCIGKNYENHFKFHMTRYGVDLPSTKISKNTGGFKLIYDTHGNRTLDVLEIAEKIFPEDIPRKCLKAKVILIAPILQEVDLDFIRFLREESEAILFLDPQGLIREINEDGRIRESCEKHLASKLASLVDILKPNEHESVVLTGLRNPSLSARQLIDWGAKVGIVTLAERGSIISDRENSWIIPAYKTLAKDPTGAGDTYAGAFIKAYLDDKSLLDCGLFASAAASIKVEYTGPDFPLKYKAVIQRVREIKLTRI